MFFFSLAMFLHWYCVLSKILSNKNATYSIIIYMHILNTYMHYKTRQTTFGK